MKNSKKRLTKGGKLVLLLLLIILIISQILFANKLFDIIKPMNNRDDDITIKYSQGSDTTSKINYREGEEVPFDNSNDFDGYVLSYVKDFDLAFKYKYAADRVSNVKINYTVQSDLLAYYKESADETSNPKIWEKKTLIKEDTVSFESANYNMTIPVNIVLADYLTKINDFKAEINLPLDGYIVVELQVNIEGLLNDKTFNDTYTDSIKIPITNSVFKIDTLIKNPVDKVVYIDDTVNANIETIAGIIFITVVNFICLLAVIKVLFLHSKQTKYERIVTRILRNYDDVIVNTSTPVELQNYNVIEILEFKELLNLAREYSAPVFYYPYPDKRVCMFYILKDNNLYLYAIGE